MDGYMGIQQELRMLIQLAITGHSSTSFPSLLYIWRRIRVIRVALSPLELLPKLLTVAICRSIGYAQA